MNKDDLVTQLSENHKDSLVKADRAKHHAAYHEGFSEAIQDATEIASNSETPETLRDHFRMKAGISKIHVNSGKDSIAIAKAGGMKDGYLQAAKTADTWQNA